ncbi:MAG TPA: hypothetical protein VMZ52_12760 [Bryobacteraceae bacterium]|nr:hypothetical protein [Bryobacteraceae bacterium]
MRIVLLHLILLLVVILSGCQTEAEKPPVIGEAFAGPISLNLRQEITPGSKTVATVKHGERLEIIQTRRRFVRVRTPRGVDGWTDVKQLMSPEQMAELKALFARAAALPSQGAATSYAPLNMHTDPSRPSPTFYQITEGQKVDVVAHKLTPRKATGPPAQLSLPKPPPPKKKPKAEKKRSGVPPPPPGPAPKLPEDWLSLSKTEVDESQAEQKPAKPEEPPAPVALEDWSLVRTNDGKAGWVLTRNLSMAIPDEVAQYAEGHRITSYFSLGEVHDDGQVKHNWLWTTIANGNFDYDFDSFRVFIWNIRRHRYETAYIERKLEGFYPVLAKAGANPSFSLVTRDSEGKQYRKWYAFEGYRVRLTRKEPWQPDAELRHAGSLPEDSESRPGEASRPPFTQRVKDWMRGLLKR